MDAHSRHIFTALLAMLRLALACAPRDETLQRSLRATLKHTEAALRDEAILRDVRSYQQAP